MAQDVPVIGITGTGGAGKSSITDELVLRFTRDFPDKSVAILAVDPSRQRTGGALLGDRIRMNSINSSRIYMRSLATRDSQTELSAALQDAIDVVRAAGFDLVFVETSGIGQGNAGVVGVCDVSLYVMTCEFGAPTQLEKIDMLDFADVVAINKFERKGSEDALRNVRKQYRRNRNRFDAADEALPVFGTIASQFNDPGTNVLYRALLDVINGRKGTEWHSSLQISEKESLKKYVIPTDRIHYLGEIVQAVRGYRRQVSEQVGVARRLFQLSGAREVLGDTAAQGELDKQLALFDARLNEEPKRILKEWPELKASYRRDQLVTKVREKEIRSDLYSTPSPEPVSPRSVSPILPIGAKSCAGACWRTPRAISPSPPGSSRSSGPKRIPSGSLPGRGPRSGPTAASTTSARMTTPSAFQPRSTA